MYTIESLSKSNLTLALQLRDTIFQDLSKCEKETLEASLDINNKKYKNCLSQNQISYLEYFVMIETKTKQVIGLTGIYTEKNDNECWLGWFCIDENYRKNALGQKLLEFSINRAKELKKKILKLYTYNSEEYKPAMKLYEKNCFVETNREKQNIYYQLDLRQVITKYRYIKEEYIMKHPFEPQIIKNSKSMIIGTLPPDNIEFYYSNSSNTRMWDLLKSIQKNTKDVPRNSYKLPTEEKKEILAKLNLSMADIILEYERKQKSTNDSDIIPKKYNNIENIIKDTSIENLLFVYKSALQWFLHSLKHEQPIELKKLPKIKNEEYEIICNILLNEKTINCILLPNPLSRGKKGETLEFKKETYKKWITKQS